jgi:TolB-like protein/DNA-binding SARP family transcriptional activator
VEIAGKKNQALLTYLALNAGKKLTREKLMGLLWSDRGETQARSSLRQALASLRRDLRDIEPSPLASDGDTVALDGSAIATDVGTFETLAGAASAEELRRAMSIYQGDLLDGLAVRDAAFDDWLAFERSRLRELAIGALMRLTAEASGGEAIAAGRRLVALDPLREASHCALMQAHAVRGQLEQAIRQYNDCRDTLRRELDVAPSARVEELYRQIKEGRYPVGSATGVPAGREPASPSSETQYFEKPSIAVLPFANLSGEIEQEYFSDGIAEDIITELLRFRFLSVIARNSSFAYKGQVLDPREIGRSLGVGYLLEGSVRRSANRVRVTAQLIDAGTGGHLWAERYDRELEDIFSVQEEIARRIVTSLAFRIEAEAIDVARRKPPGDMRAYDYYLRAKWLIDAPHDGADMRQAREYCDRAIEIDPSYARAHAMKAFTFMVGIDLMGEVDVEESRRRALQSAEMAVMLDPMDGVSHWSLAEAAILAEQPDRALDHMARALAINPNDANVLFGSGYIRALAGDPEGGLRQMTAVLEQNPSSLPWYHWLRGFILYIEGRFEEALRAFNLHNPLNPAILSRRAATLVELGRIDEARADIKMLLAMRPGASVREARKFQFFTPGLERYLDNLRRAGLPE